MTFRFLHAADLHLDTPFTGVSATAQQVASLLRDASLEAFDALVRLAISREVDAVILAGDLYDGAARGLRAQVELRRGLQELSDRGVRTFIVSGNHDPVDEGWTAITDWPELVVRFGADEWRSVEIERDGSVVATVHGISYGTRDVPEDLAALLPPVEGRGPQVAVLHANVDDHPDHEAQSPCALDTLTSAGIHYWALGHVHEAAVLHRDPWVVYSGTTQARHHGTTEWGPKGAYLVEIDDTGSVSEPELVALDVVRFDRLEHDIDGCADLAALRDRLVDLGRARLAAADGRSVLLSAELGGRGPVHGELHRPGALADLLDGLRADSVSDAPFLWWDRIDVATRPVQDLDELQGRNDFVADLLDETASLLDDPDARALRVDGWIEELPSDLTHLLDGQLPDAGEPSRWSNARDIAIDLVSSDES